MRSPYGSDPPGLLVGGPDVTTSGSRSDKRMYQDNAEYKLPLAIIVAPCHNLLFLRNPDAVASGPPIVPRFRKCSML